MFRMIWDFIRSLASVEQPSVASVVNQYFLEDDRAATTEFYNSWYRNNSLKMQLGDGLHDLDREQFFSSAWVNFVWPPFESGGRLLLAIDAESGSGSVCMDLESGEVSYVYDDVPTLLSSSFTEFLLDLEMAGWKPPAGDTAP